MTPLYQTHSIKTNCITDFNGLYYSKEDHVHSLDEVCGLCDALAGKSDIDHLHDKRYYIRGVDTFEFDMQPHTHPITDVCRLCIELSCIDEKISGKADINHVHSTSEVVDLDNQLRCLTEALAGKSDIGHTHDNYPISAHTHKLSDVCKLTDCLNDKACKNHKHKISDVSNLQTCLNNKSDVGHTHNYWYWHVHCIGEVSGLQTCLDNKACVDHTHCIADIDNLQDCLDSKACVDHFHCIGDIVSLQSCLDNKACVNHTHDWSGIDIDVDLSAYASIEYVESNYAIINHVHNNYAIVDHKHNANEICWVNPHCGAGRSQSVADGLNHLWKSYLCDITHCHTGCDIFVQQDCGAGTTNVNLNTALKFINDDIKCVKTNICNLTRKLEGHWHEFNSETCQNEIKFPPDTNKSVGNTYTGLSTDYSSGSTQVFNGVGVYEINNNKPTKELIRIVAQMLPPETIQNIIKLENYSGGHYNPFVVKWHDTEEELQIPLLGGSVVAEYYLNPGDSISVNVKEPVGLGPDSSASPNITVYRYNIY